MTVLVGGMRGLNANFEQSSHGVFTKRQHALVSASIAAIWRTFVSIVFHP